MGKNIRDNDSFDVLPLLLLIWRWKFALLGLSIFAGGLTYFISKSMTPLYESHTILYPSSTNDRYKQLEEFSFGYEIHSERLMQMLNSDVILDSVNQRFDLISHYEINTARRDWYDKFMQKARDRIHYHKTQFSSVVISVIDKDPHLAAAIANDIPRLVNLVNAEIVRTNARKVLEAVKEEYSNREGKVSAINDSIVNTMQGVNGKRADQLEKQIYAFQRKIKVLRDSLNSYRKNYNIYDFAAQIDVLNGHLAEARANYLQESGRLEVLENDNSVSDSTLTRTRAAKTGAKKRLSHFQAELNSLSAINADYSALTDEIELLKELMANAHKEVQKLSQNPESQISNWSLSSLQQTHDWDQIQAQELKKKYQRALSNYLDPVPASYVISPARASFIKVYPNTMLNVILSVIGTMLFTIVVLLFVERIRPSMNT